MGLEEAAEFTCWMRCGVKAIDAGNDSKVEDPLLSGLVAAELLSATLLGMAVWE